LRRQTLCKKISGKTLRRAILLELFREKKMETFRSGPRPAIKIAKKKKEMVGVSWVTD